MGSSKTIRAPGVQLLTNGAAAFAPRTKIKLMSSSQRQVAITVLPNVEVKQNVTSPLTRLKKCAISNGFDRSCPIF